MFHLSNSGLEIKLPKRNKTCGCCVTQNLVTAFSRAVSVRSEAVVQPLLAVAKGHDVVPITVNQSEKRRGFVSAPSRTGPGAAGLSLRRCPLSRVAHFLLLKAGGRKFGFFVH